MQSERGAQPSRSLGSASRRTEGTADSTCRLVPKAIAAGASAERRRQRSRRPSSPSATASIRLSTPFHKYDHVGCVDLRFWRGATREHPSQWGCDRGATKPEPKSDATLRAAVLFGPDFVAHSLQTAEGYARRSRLVWAKNPSPQTW